MDLPRCRADGYARHLLAMDLRRFLVFDFSGLAVDSDGAGCDRQQLVHPCPLQKPLQQDSRNMVELEEFKRKRKATFAACTRKVHEGGVEKA